MHAFAVLRDAVVEWWRNWLRLTALNLVWMCSWLAVVFGPPVTIAVYAYLERLFANDEMTPAEFVDTVRRSFGKGWLWALPVFGSAAALFLALPFYAQFADLWARAAEIAAALLVLGWLFLQFYALPYLHAQERPSLRLALKNAVITALASPLYSLLVACFLVIACVLSARFMALTFFFTPVLIAVAGTLAVRERLTRFGVLEGQAPSAE